MNGKGSVFPSPLRFEKKIYLSTRVYERARSEAERKVLMFILIVARSEAESQKRSAAERNAYALLSRNCLCTISEAKNSFCILTKVSLILLKNP